MTPTPRPKIRQTTTDSDGTIRIIETDGRGGATSNTQNEIKEKMRRESEQAQIEGDKGKKGNEGSGLIG